VNMTIANKKIEVVTVTEQRRRRWSIQGKADLARLTYEPGMSVSLVARQHGVAASQLFNWRKLDREGALIAVASGESVVPASELANARAQIAQLQRLLGKNGMDASSAPIIGASLPLGGELRWNRPWLALTLRRASFSCIGLLPILEK